MASHASDHHTPPKHTDLLGQCNFPQQLLKLRDLLNWIQIRLYSEASNAGDDYQKQNKILPLISFEALQMHFGLVTKTV